MILFLNSEYQEMAEYNLICTDLLYYVWLPNLWSTVNPQRVRYFFRQCVQVDKQ